MRVAGQSLRARVVDWRRRPHVAQVSGAAATDQVAVRHRRATVLVWLTWVLTTAAAGASIARHARRYPFSDDWLLVPTITGERPLTLPWLWSQHAEHRLFVPRLVLTSLTRLADGDFRPAVWLNLVLLAVTACSAILTMRRVRGYTTITDAFFPLVMLSFVHRGLNWGFQLHFTSVGVVAVGVLLIMTRYGLDAPARWLWAATVLSVVLLGEGGPGLSLLPGLCLWLALSGLRLRHTTPIHGTLIMAAVAALLTGIGLYFVGYNGARRWALVRPWRLLVCATYGYSPRRLDNDRRVALVGRRCRHSPCGHSRRACPGLVSGFLECRGAGTCRCSGMFRGRPNHASRGRWARAADPKTGCAGSSVTIRGSSCRSHAGCTWSGIASDGRCDAKWARSCSS